MGKRSGAALLNLAAWIVIATVASSTFLVIYLGVGFHAVLSNSMAPSHPAGSVVVTIQSKTKDIKVGDVIKLPLPNSSDQSYVHRVVEAKPHGGNTIVKTKGDRNESDDPWSLEILSATTPTVIATIPLVGHLNGLTGNLWVKVSLILTAATASAIALFRSFSRFRKKDNVPRHRKSRRIPTR